jgi:hypothetical protein
MCLTAKLEPMRLSRRAESFDHAEWIFELKLDGFLAERFCTADSSLHGNKANSGVSKRIYPK